MKALQAIALAIQRKIVEEPEVGGILLHAKVRTLEEKCSSGIEMTEAS